MNRRSMPIIFALAAFGSPLLGDSPTTALASCDTAITTPVIDAADAAGIGTVLGNNDGIWVVEITSDIKDNLPDQVGVRVVDDGDIGWSAGRDISALFYVEGTQLTTNDCAQPSAAQLEAWTPPVSRAGDISHILGGDWGSYRTVAFDSGGDPVAYGREPGTVISMHSCSDGSTVAELVESDNGMGQVALRSLDDFAVFDTGPATLPGDASDHVLVCDGSTAEAVDIVASDDDQFIASGVAPDWEADALSGLELSSPVATNPDTSVPEADELALAEPPSVGGWSPWLLVLGAAAGAAYLIKKAQDPDWRASWNKPDNARNSTGGRRREDATGQGRFN